MQLIFRFSARRQSFFIKFGNKLVELLKGNRFVGSSLFVNVNGVQHFKDFVIAHPIAGYSSEMLNLFEIDDLVLLVVDVTEDSTDAFFGLHISYFWTDKFQKLLKIDRFVLRFQVFDEGESESAFLDSPNYSMILLISSGSMVPEWSSSNNSKTFLSCSYSSGRSLSFQFTGCFVCRAVVLDGAVVLIALLISCNNL